MSNTERLPPHLKLALATIPAFTDDGKLGLDELEQLLALALQDGAIDDEEKRVLRNVLDRAEADGVAPDVLARIQQVRAQHALGG